MKLPTVEWHWDTGKSPTDPEPDDFTFYHGDYCLRVEQMDSRYWWWSVYFRDEEIEFDDPKATTRDQAMDYAIYGFYADFIWRKS